MSSRNTMLRFGKVSLGSTALTALGVLAFSQPALAANCCATAVKALGVTRTVSKSGASKVTAPTGALAFTGAAGVATAVIIGLLLIAAGATIFSFARGKAINRNRIFVIAAGCAAAVVALLGAHSADAAVPTASGSCCPTVASPTTGTTATDTTTPTQVSGTSTTTGAPPADPGTGTTPTGPADPGSGGSGSGGTATGTTPPASLPDASTPISLILAAGAVGSLVVYRRRRSAV